MEDMKVMVYDNEEGYFNFLVEAISGKAKSVEFIKHTGRGEDFDMLVFFMHSQLELLDFFKLYKKDIPVIYASSLPQHNHELDDNTVKENIYYLDLNHHKGQLEENIRYIFKKIVA